MDSPLPAGDPSESHVTVRYWAAARAAAGVESEQVPPGTLAEVISEIRQRHRQSSRFADLIGSCAVLIGEVPVASRNPDEVRLRAGDQVEFLPPFAGGA